MQGVYTPAARQPTFQCSQCIRHFYNAAGLKNHFRAKHRSQAINDGASQTSSLVLDQLPSQESTGPLSPLLSSDGVPMDVDFEHQPPFPDDYDEHDDYGMDYDLPGSDSHSSPPIIPSSPGLQHESRPHGHQQTATGDKFLKRVYHGKLNGEFIMYFSHFINLHITFRSEM
jgi:hypothetical protein